MNKQKTTIIMTALVTMMVFMLIDAYRRKITQIKTNETKIAKAKIQPAITLDIDTRLMMDDNLSLASYLAGRLGVDYSNWWSSVRERRKELYEVQAKLEAQAKR